jgi:hypothetical protein
VASDGAATRREILAYGPEWDWLLAITPMPDFEGRPVGALLEWVARERGWSLVYADPETEGFAGGTALQGSLRRLRIDESLEAATLASRLAYRVDGGVLLVSSRSPAGRDADPMAAPKDPSARVPPTR